MAEMWLHRELGKKTHADTAMYFSAQNQQLDPSMMLLQTE